MRLIDVDELKINLYHNKKVVLNDDLVKCIDDTKTAYSVDKVVEELEEVHEKFCKNVVCDELCEHCEEYIMFKKISKSSSRALYLMMCASGNISMILSLLVIITRVNVLKDVIIYIVRTAERK